MLEPDTTPRAHVPSGPAQVSVLLVDPVRAYADAVALALRTAPGIGRVRVATPGADATWLVSSDTPDVVLLNLAGAAGEETVRGFRALAPHTRLVVTGAPSAPEQLVTLVEAGVLGIVDGTDSFARLVEVLRAVARDEALVGPALGGALVRRLAELSAGRLGAQGPDLTDREVQILRLVAEGMSNQQIADDLGISLRTVKNHVHNLLGKLGARRRGEAAAALRRLERQGVLA